MDNASTGAARPTTPNRCEHEFRPASATYPVPPQRCRRRAIAGTARCVVHTPRPRRAQLRLDWQTRGRERRSLVAWIDGASLRLPQYIDGRRIQLHARITGTLVVISTLACVHARLTLRTTHDRHGRISQRQIAAMVESMLGIGGAR